VKFPVDKTDLFDCTFIGGTSLDVSPACPYPSPSILLLNVLGQTAATLGDKKKKKVVSRKTAKEMYNNIEGELNLRVGEGKG